MEVVLVIVIVVLLVGAGVGFFLFRRHYQQRLQYYDPGNTRRNDEARRSERDGWQHREKQ